MDSRRCVITLVFLSLQLLNTYQIAINEDFLKFLRNSKGRGHDKRSTPSSRENARWPKKVIPYKKNAGLSNKVSKFVDQGIAYLEEKTCVDWVDIESPEYHNKDLGHSVYIEFKMSDSTCATNVGKGDINSGVIDLQMSEACAGDDMRAAVHEMLHVLGFQHEQVRPDRNTVINYYKDRLVSYLHFQYNTNNHTNTTITKYDISSIMQYDAAAGLTQKAKDAGHKYTMELFDNTTILTRREVAGGNYPAIGPGYMRDGSKDPLSHLDSLGANIYYDCAAECSEKLLCRNGGYQDKSCTCICPTHTQGTLCELFKAEKNSQDCTGPIFNATIDSTAELKSPQNSAGKFYHNRECLWMIQAPPNSVIGVKFTVMDMEGKYGPGDRGDGDCDTLREDKYNLGYDLLYIYLFGTDISHWEISCLDAKHYLNKWSYSDSNQLIIKWKSDKRNSVFGGEIKAADVAGWKLQYKAFPIERTTTSTTSKPPESVSENGNSNRNVNNNLENDDGVGDSDDNNAQVEIRCEAIKMRVIVENNFNPDLLNMSSSVYLGMRTSIKQLVLIALGGGSKYSQGLTLCNNFLGQVIFRSGSVITEFEVAMQVAVSPETNIMQHQFDLQKKSVAALRSVMEERLKSGSPSLFGLDISARTSASVTAQTDLKCHSSLQTEIIDGVKYCRPVQSGGIHLVHNIHLVLLLNMFNVISLIL